MKSAFNFLVCFICFGSFLAKAEYIPKDYYYVVSDEKKDSLKPGTSLLIGKVYEAYSEQGVGGAIISNIDRSRRTKTNEDGTFELLLSQQDSAVFFFHPKYKEIVCWSYDFKSQHLVTMNFVTSEKLPEGVIEVTEKPVIYLYSDENQEVSIRADFAENIDFSYPKYQDGWNIEVDVKGNLISDNKTYPYIFWDGKKDGLGFEWESNSFQGFQIKTDTSVQFFENSLYSLGLNERESADFITYWGPRIIQFPYALVQFYVDEDYDRKIGDLSVQPNPDIERRVFMLWQGQEFYLEDLNVKKPDFKSINREGLVLIEWGGTELKPVSQLISDRNK